MASLGKHHDKGFRIHWRFTIRAGPRTAEPIRGSLLLGRCTPAAAKVRLRQIEDWEEAALKRVDESSFVALGLHDCYGQYWMPHYEGFLAQLRARGTLRTLADVAAEQTLRSAR